LRTHQASLVALRQSRSLVPSEAFCPGEPRLADLDDLCATARFNNAFPAHAESALGAHHPAASAHVKRPILI
jgi:hypothetical protein